MNKAKRILIPTRYQLHKATVPLSERPEGLHKLLSNILIVGNKAVVSNRWLMIIVPIQGDGQYHIIPAEIFKQAHSLAKKAKAENIDLAVTNSHVVFSDMKKTLPRDKEELQALKNLIPRIRDIVATAKSNIAPAKRLWFNADFLSRGASALGTEQICLYASANPSVLFIRSTDLEEKGYGVLMPVRAPENIEKVPFQYRKDKGK